MAFTPEEEREIKKLAREAVGGTPLEQVEEVDDFESGDLVPFMKYDGDNNTFKTAKIAGTNISSGGGGGGGEPSQYLKDASVSQDGNTLTLTKKNNSTVTFTPNTGGGTGTVTGVKVGSEGSVINPTQGVVTIPPYESGAQAHIAPTASEVKTALGTGSGTTKYLREDGEWATPSGGGGGGNTADVNYDATNKKITKTIDGVTSDVVTVATLKTDMNLGNVGNFKAVSTEASQGLTDTEKSNARTNIGAGTSNFSGDYDDLSNKPTIPCADKSYLPLEHSGLGRKTLKLEDGNNILMQTDFNQSYCVYIIQYDFVLDENITIPTNCILEFNGGSISGTYTIIGNNTGISAGLVKIFNTNISLAGSWNVSEAYPEWFGAKGDGITDDSIFIKKALTINERKKVVLSKGKTYAISSFIPLNNYTELVINGNILSIDASANITTFDTVTHSTAFNGNHDIYIHGTGTYTCAIPEGADLWVAPIQVAHSKNVIIEGLTFENYLAHCIEIAATDGIEIRNCKFYGSVQDNGGNDVIQLDLNKYTEGGGATSGLCPEYDDVAVHNCTISNCFFKPKSGLYCNACIGSHNYSENTNEDLRTFKNIHIVNNYFYQNTPYANKDGQYIAAIRMDSYYDGVWINNNSFDGDCVSIQIYRSHYKNIFINKNKFAPTSVYTILINDGSIDNIGFMKNITISENYFQLNENGLAFVCNGNGIISTAIHGPVLFLNNIIDVEANTMVFYISGDVLDYAKPCIMSGTIINGLDKISDENETNLRTQLQRFVYDGTPIVLDGKIDVALIDTSNGLS